MTRFKPSATKIVFFFLSVLLSLSKEGWILTELILHFWLCPLPSIFLKGACFTQCLWTSRQIILSLFPAAKGDSHIVSANGVTIHVLDLFCQKGRNAEIETVTIKNNSRVFLHPWALLALWTHLNSLKILFSHSHYLV